MKLKSRNKIIVVAGATAVGKTSLSIELAKALNCDIISADSRQVYKEMHIGTAKPTLEERQGIIHHFINIVSVKEDYNVGKYESQVKSFWEKYFTKNNTVIVCGGTGLYIESLINGLDYFPEVSPEIKKSITLKYKQKGIEYLKNRLKESDLEYYFKVDKNNPHRLIRALSVIEATGNKFSSFLKGKQSQNDFEFIKILLELPRDILYRRIEDRVDEMIRLGLIEEAKDLFEYKHLNSLQTVGYKELFAYFDGEIPLEKAIELIKRNTRRYAKRQMTWFRNRGKWNVFSPKEKDKILKLILSYDILNKQT